MSAIRFARERWPRSEAARNVACAGGEPLALTDCLNFGNLEKPEIGWELAEAIEGIAQAAEALGIPVVSGNVSLYNETAGRAIPPTPFVGCVGVRTFRRVPRGWRMGDVVLADDSRAARPPPLRRSSCRSSGVPHRTALSSTMSAWVEGRALRDVCWSRIDADVDLPRTHRRSSPAHQATSAS